MDHADVGHHLRPRGGERARMLCLHQGQVGINRGARNVFGFAVADREVGAAREDEVVVGVDEVFEGALAECLQAQGKTGSLGRRGQGGWGTG